MPQLRRKLPAKVQLPSWSPEQLQELMDFIGQYELIADSNRAAFGALKQSDLVEHASASATYWKHTGGAFRWLRSHIQRVLDVKNGGRGTGRDVARQHDSGG